MPARSVGGGTFAHAQSFGEARTELRKERIDRISAPRRLGSRASHQAEPCAGHPRRRPRNARAFPGDRRMEGVPARRHFRKSGCADRSRAASARLCARRAKAGRCPRRSVDRLNALLGASKATTKPEEIVKAARYARVDTLFLTGDDHLWGWFDESEDRVVAHGSCRRWGHRSPGLCRPDDLAPRRVGDARRARAVAAAGSLCRDPQILNDRYCRTSGLRKRSEFGS